MFDFFAKRRSADPVVVSDNAVADSPAREREDARRSALERAAALSHNEAEAVAFVLDCEFPEARLRAAERLQSAEAWEKVHQAMRNVDRRLSKLAQAHLQALSAKTEQERRARQCISQALTLLQSNPLMANQVAQLDRLWESLGEVEPQIAEEFQTHRAQLTERLQMQAALQRSVLDATTHLRELKMHLEILDLDATRATFESIASEMQEKLSQPEAQALPRNVLTDLEAGLEEMHMLLQFGEQQRSVQQQREQLLEQWQAAAPGSLDRVQMEQAWAALGSLPRDDASLLMQQRFDQVIDSLGTVVHKELPIKKIAPSVDPEVLDTWRAKLDELEQALEAGSLHAASEADKVLRSLEAAGKAGSHAQMAKWNKLHGDLQHLQGWARWGGKISREELIKAAVTLAQDKYAPAELAKRVGTLREQWKSLDTTSGPANRELWATFDNACTTAYAPAAAHFKKLAEERQHNQEKAEKLVAEVLAFAQKSGCTQPDTASVDWKAVAAFCTRTEQTWRQFGNMDRKAKKRLDQEFADVMQALRQPLADRQRGGVEQRVALIDAVTALSLTDRRALEQLQKLQEQWQEQARSLPLERKEEQALWTRFRAACDEFFAQRKVQAAQADAERKGHLKQKEAICQHLEELDVQIPVAEANKAMRDAKDAWGKIGVVPRAVEDKIEARFRNACLLIQQRINESRKQAEESESQSLARAIGRCRDAERAYLGGASFDESMLLVKSGDAKLGNYEKLLQARMTKLHAAWERNDPAYRAQLQKNRDVLRKEILRAEIQLGLDSPADLARERMQLQVEILQASLKAGRQIDKAAILQTLCSSAAEIADADVSRLEKLVMLLRKSA